VVQERVCLGAEANLESDDQRFVEVVRAWCDEALARLLPAFDRPGGQSGRGLTAWIAVLPTSRSEVETAPYTPEAWSAIIADLGGRLDSSLAIFGPEAEEPTRGRLSVSRTLDGRWVSLLVQAVADWHDANDAVYCTRWVDFLAATLDQANPAFGVVTDDNLVNATAVDVVLHRRHKRSLDDSRRFLRGYGFATVVPTELVDRLGGVRELADTGAFVRVQSLRGGGVVLQATARCRSTTTKPCAGCSGRSHRCYRLACPDPCPASSMSGWFTRTPIQGPSNDRWTPAAETLCECDAFIVGDWH
jgi:hypothetical protein